ncbi:hypothetical protein BC940DRAFT_307722 [Gongronella butleri]|nr:hypothetical protein BC940DRAFT_307722 [Gongronella butleri]
MSSGLETLSERKRLVLQPNIAAGTMITFYSAFAMTNMIQAKPGQKKNSLPQATRRKTMPKRASWRVPMEWSPCKWNCKEAANGRRPLFWCFG